RDERDLAKKVKEELLPDLLVIDSEIEKEYFIKEVAGITGISPGNIYSDLKKINIKSLPQPTNETVQSRTKIPEENFADLEKEIWGYYVVKDKSEEVKNQILEIAGEEEFQ